MEKAHLSGIVLALLLVLSPLFSYASTTAVPSSRSEIYSFINQVWETNPGIQSVEAEVIAAKANASALSRPIYNPELELNGEQVHKDAQEDTYTVGISQPIDLFNKRGANRQVGQASLAEVQALLAAKKLSVGTAAFTALVNFNVAQEIADLARKRTELLRSFVQLTEKKHAVGDLGQAALDQAKLALSEAIAQQASTEIALNQAKEALAAITNDITNAWPALPNKLPQPPQFPNDPTSLLQQLPSLQVLHYRANTANARIKVAQTNTRPDPTISLRGGEEDKNALVGLTFSIPLFVRNNFHDQVAGANQEAIAADKARLDAYWHAKARLQGSISRYKILYRSYSQWQEISAGSLNSGIKLLNKLWDAGEINTTDYLIQLKQRIDNQIAGTELQGQTWQAWFQWLDASGNLNQWLGDDGQPNKRDIS